jgi:hypothetical protein
MKSTGNSSTQFFPYFLPTVIFLSVFAGCLALGPFLFNVDGDLGRHLTIGRVILDRMAIPTIDEFSHTRYGDPFSPHEWLAQVVFRLFYDWLGLSGVVLFTAALLGLVFFLLTYRVFMITRSTPLTLILIVIGIAASRIHWLARPHIFTYLYLFLWIEVLNSRQALKWKILWAGLLMLGWVNTHGAFVSGITVTGIYLGSSILSGWVYRSWKNELKRVEEYSVLLLISLALSLVNPDGFRIWQTIYGFLSSRYLVSHTAEYMPPVLYQAGVIPFTLLVVISLLFIVLYLKRLSLNSIALLLIFSLFGITSGRNIPLFILISLPILAECSTWLLPRLKLHLDRLFDEIREDTGAMRFQFGYTAILAMVIFGFGVLLFKLQPGLTERNQYSPARYPVAAVDWMQQHPWNGRIFNDFMWGGYLLFRDWPQTRVFIDGQTDFYGEALTRDYETIINGWAGWDTLLDHYKVDEILIPVKSSFVDTLKSNGGWKLIYSDSTAVIFTKD